MRGTAEALFRKNFLPLYPEDAKNDLGRARAEDANPAKNASILHHLEEAARIFVELAPRALGMSELLLDYTAASIHRLSAALTTERLDRLANDGEPGTSKNALFNFVVHGSAYVGACIVKEHGGEWAVRRPLWESLVRLRSHAGEGELPIFHWWLKSIADDPTATLADRYRAHVEVPCLRPEELPIIAPPDRKLPRLGKVRYDAFYKYLRANLPELRDVGEDFPSPERFAELGFKHVSFTLVGGGRMLVVHGPTPHGLAAYWLTKEGFVKGAFWPCDAFPEPILRVRDEEKIEVILQHEGKQQSFELLWWGP
jgi:hypothetical protein